MKKRIFSVAALSTAFVFWFFDASVHYFVYGEPQFEFIPHDFNELWMRIVIILLIILFGIFTDYSSRKMLIAQKQLEAARIYNSMIHAAHHILNNLLNQLQLVRMEVLKSKDFNRDIIKIYDASIDEASDLIRRLSQVENITEGDIRASIDPSNIANSFNSANPADAKKQRG